MLLVKNNWIKSHPQFNLIDLDIYWIYLNYIDFNGSISNFKINCTIRQGWFNEGVHMNTTLPHV